MASRYLMFRNSHRTSRDESGAGGGGGGGVGVEGGCWESCWYMLLTGILSFLNIFGAENPSTNSSSFSSNIGTFLSSMLIGVTGMLL